MNFMIKGRYEVDDGDQVFEADLAIPYDKISCMMSFTYGGDFALLRIYLVGDSTPILLRTNEADSIRENYEQYLYREDTAKRIARAKK